MNRLQKKCLIVSASCHGLLLLVLLVGPAFFISRDKVESHQLLNMVSGRVVDDAMSSGGRPNVSEAPPAAPVLPPAVEPPKNDPPKVVETVKPTPQPKPIEQVKPTPPKPDDFTIVKAKKIEPVKPQTDEFQAVSHPLTKPPKTNPNSTANKNPTDTKAPQSSDNSKQIAAAMKNVTGLKSGLSSGAKIEFNGQSGDSDALVSNYDDIVKSIYDHAWTPATSAVKSAGAIRVRITIARNGRVTRSEIISRSGDIGMEKSVQNALDSVNFIEPFPDNARDLERTYIIDFDPLNKLSS